jgi:hypothetical protein
MLDERYACIGGRPFDAMKNPTGLVDAQLQVCYELGVYLAELGIIVDSGNAPGADQAYGRGVNSVDPSLLHLHLPWKSFEAHAVVAGNVVHLLGDLDTKTLGFYTELAAKYHNHWRNLKATVRPLMVRNSSIIIPPPATLATKRVIAFPSTKRGGGGTGQGMRIAEGEGIPLSDISKMGDAQLEALCNLIAEGR